MSKQQELLDQFAQSALNALITKMPFFDIEGEHGVKIDPSELQKIKQDLAATAYEYASWMMIARETQKLWLKINIEKNENFGL